MEMKNKKHGVNGNVIMLGIGFTIAIVAEVTWIGVDVFSFLSGIITTALFFAFYIASREE